MVTGVRLASIVAEIAVYQNWNVFGMLDGEFAHSMFDTDFNLDFKLGLSY